MPNREHLKILFKLGRALLIWRLHDLLHRDAAMVNVFGDSHTRYFRHLQRTRPLAGAHFRVFNVTGATASGLTNPRSQTRALPAFRLLLRALDRRQWVVFALGEVDCGFVVWTRARQAGTEPEHEARRALASYLAFLAEVRRMGFEKIAVTTVSPPTIVDSAAYDDPVNTKRRQVLANLEERSRMTGLFNAELRAAASRDGYVFLDVEREYVDPATGRVRPCFVSPRPGDIHLDNDQAARALRQAVRAAGIR